MTMRLAGRLVAVALVLLVSVPVLGQRGRGGGPPQAPQPPQSPQASAPIDLTGHWVAIVNEDWRWRMVTPPAKDYASVPLNAEGRRIADAWDVSKDGSCLAYGAAGLMRLPTRLRTGSALLPIVKRREMPPASELATDRSSSAPSRLN